MDVAYVIVTSATIIANLAAAIGDFGGAKVVRANAARVNVPESWILPLGVLKAAGATGLLVALFDERAGVLGIAAAAGLVLFFTGAVIAHIRVRAFGGIGYPSGYWLLAAGSLALAVMR